MNETPYSYGYGKTQFAEVTEAPYSYSYGKTQFAEVNEAPYSYSYGKTQFAPRKCKYNAKKRRSANERTNCGFGRTTN